MARSEHTKQLISEGIVWKNEENKWCRKCPSCYKILSYKQSSHCFDLMRKKCPCISCSKSGKNNPNYGKPRSNETNLKISKGNTGKIRSDEVKNRISFTKKQQPIPQGNNQFSWKKYTFPDGRIENVQGWEPWTLDLLLSSSISPNDIKIKDGRPTVPYEWSGSMYRYLPDCYILSSNTIVETKSPWTLNSHYDQSMAKIRGSIKKGYNVRLLIWNRRRRLKSDTTYTA